MTKNIKSSCYINHLEINLLNIKPPSEKLGEWSNGKEPQAHESMIIHQIIYQIEYAIIIPPPP